MNHPSDLKLVERPSNRRSCVYCHDVIAYADPTWQCPRCATFHHDACAGEHGRCAVFSCETPVPGARARTTRAGVAAPPTRLERWGVAVLVLAMREARAVRALSPRAVAILMYSAGVCWCGWKIYRLIFPADSG